MKKKLLLMLVLFIGCSSVLAQQLTIKGTITDAKDGVAVVGAAVMQEGTDNVVLSDLYGNYEIKVKEGALLRFSYLGYLSQDVIASSNQPEVNIVFEEELTSIDAVVAVGYGVTKKKLVTGANLSVKGDDVAKMNTASAMEALQGVAPGLSVTKNNGAPGSGTKVNIRGIGTVGNSSPLYIVDGVEVGNIDNINPLSIESIDVLKDAASAAIYGSRAANGVILVTTKKGRQNQKTEISYSGYYGVQNMAYTPSSLTAQEYMYIQDEMRINSGMEARDWKSQLATNLWLDSQNPGSGTEYGNLIWDKLQSGWEGTNWLDEMTYNNAPVTSHTVNISGGGSKATYALGAAYYNQSGLIGGDIIGAGYERINLSLNTDLILWAADNGRPIVTFGENMTYTNSSSKSVATGNQYSNDVYNALSANPLMLPYWEGSIDDSKIGPNLDFINENQTNPLAVLYYDRSQFSDNHSNNIRGNAYLNIEPIRDLVIRSSFGINASFGSGRSYTPTNKGFGTKRTANLIDKVSQSMNQFASYTWTNTVSYKTEIGKHALNFLLGNEMNTTMINMSVNGSKKNSLYTDLEHAYLNNTTAPNEITDISVGGVDWAATGGGLLSFMARASYSYDDKYMVDVTMRADGSSNFAKGKKWGYFPSVSAGWNFSEEEFLEDAEWLSFGKLRASWGQNGNQTLMNSGGGYVSFAYTPNISTPGNGGYYFGERLIPNVTSFPSNIPNEDLTWETSEQLNFGVDLKLFDSRFGITFDWYKKTTKDWLVVAPVFGTSGAGAPFINGGEIENSGTELTVNWNDQVGDFSYGVTLSGYTNVNKVTELASASGYINGPGGQLFNNSDFVSRVEVGMPIGYFYGYQTDGLLQNQDEVDAYVNANGDPYFNNSRPGDVRFIDNNGDGKITDEDRVMIGDPNPDFQLGVQLNLSYKGAFINLTGSGKFGHQVLNGYFWGNTGDNNMMRNWTTQIFERWHGEGTSDRMPILVSVAHQNSQNISDISIYDADFFRIQNLTVGYDFSKLMKNQSWVSNISLYVSASNLATFTNYKGFDPDVAYGGDGAPWASGLDLGLYPLPRTYTVGLNLTF